LAPVTLATRAGEAGGPPLKFYKLPDNLVATIVLAPGLARRTRAREQLVDEPAVGRWPADVRDGSLSGRLQWRPPAHCRSHDSRL
jgi:hypothetical protein